MPIKIINQTKLYYTDVGHGNPIVLIHGYPLDGRIWDDVVAILSRKRRVICVDMRGFGQSGISDTFSMEDLADDMNELIKLLGIGPVPVAGLSMGGYVLFQLATTYPDALSSMILVDTRSMADHAEGKAKRDAMAAMVLEKGSSSVADAMLPNMLAAENAPKLGARLREIMESQRPETLAAACVAMRDREDYTELLSELSIPVGIVVGMQDAITPVSLANEMLSKLKSGKLFEIAGAGHMSPLEKPSEVAEALLSLSEG